MNIVTNVVSALRKDIPNVNMEFGATFLHGSIIGFSSFTNNINIPSWIRETGFKDELLVLIHNHGYDLSNFPSSEDIESYVLYGVKYGITTSNFGTIIVKNPDDVRQLNKENAEEIMGKILDIKIGMISDFEKKFNKKYDKNNQDHNKEISKMVNDNKDNYLEQYQSVMICP